MGALAGIIYNLIMAGTLWETSSLFFAGSSVLVAGATWWFWKRGWVDLIRPAHLIAAGLLTGVANALLTFMLATVFSLSLYPLTLAIYERILGHLGNPQAALLVMELVVEIIYKTFCIMLAAVAATFFIAFFRREMEKGREGGISS